ncbi:MAG: Crp/Fnr family transcriptional regulator [Bacillota bacterium]|nr:Crp/Fnr family transcriptional regulator [Bacillota bacterium]
MKEIDYKILEESLPFWEKLNEQQKELILNNTRSVSYLKGSKIYVHGEDCLGLIIIKKGRVSAFMLSDEGRETTLFRLNPGDVCVLSASCVIKQIAFDVHMDAEKDSELFILKAGLFAQLMAENIYVENFTYKLMMERFSDVMWTMQQILFKSFDDRLAQFLYGEMTETRQDTIFITHEQIAKHLSTAREVVTRMLKRFSDNGIVELNRGSINIKDKEKLKNLITKSNR